ncbi:MAG: (2Fe-2S) ferredoxin domain-containing protein [Bacteroidota bacterium]|nr:(2Fe-2S) ferredoxin domain-containing protein [Bacteroidota bacterium]
MNESENKINIVVCMGSSCFSRGNNKIIKVIEGFIKENKLENDFEVSGTLCEEECSKGPNIRIEGKLYSEVEPISIPTILMHHLKTRNN